MAETEAAQQRRGVPTAPANLPLIAEGQTTELIIKDEYYVSPEERKQYGIADDQALHWVRNPDDHQKTEKIDRIRQFSREHPGAQVVKDGREMVTNMDLVLMKYPQAQKDAQEAQERADADEWLDEIEDQRHPDHFDRRRVTREQMEEIRDYNLRAHRESRLIGGQTQGFRLADAEALYSREQTRATEDQCRRGSRAVHHSQEVWEQQMDAFENKRSGGKPTFGGFQKSGFPGTTPTAQARTQAKAKSGAGAR